MNNWETSPLDFVYLIYGLAFFSLGIVSAMLPKQHELFPFTRHLTYLGIFGILHGTLELIEMLNFFSSSSGLIWISCMLLLSSYLALFEFGRRTFNSVSQNVQLPFSRVYCIIGIGLATFMIWFPDNALSKLTIASRWMVGTPASLLTGLALFAVQRTLWDSKLTRNCAIWLSVTATAFFCYSGFTIFLSERPQYLPSWIPTNSNFILTFGFPIQLLRSLCAVTITLGLINLLRHASNQCQITATAFWSQESITIINSNKEVVQTNKAFSETTGYKPEELVGKKLTLYETELQNSFFYAEIWNHVNKTGVWRGEVLGLRKNGEIYPMWLNITAIRDYVGNITHYVLTHIDITERKKAERISQQLKVMVETAMDGFWVVDLKGSLLQVNKAYADISGYSIDELVTMHISQLEALEQSDQVKAHIEIIIEKGYDLFETRHRHKDGHLIDVEVSAAYLPDFKQFCVFCRDITERKKIEQDLRIAAIAFESQEGMFITDADSVILRVNLAFTKITGYSAEEAIGQTPRLFHSGKQKSDFYSTMWQSIHKTGAWDGEIWNRHKSGNIFAEHLTITEVRNSDGHVSHYVATMTDITESKEAASQIEHLAYHDPLTGLPNRLLLLDRLHSALASSHRTSNHGALLFIDLDKFKDLNDSRGHDVGDMLLQQVSKRLDCCIREGDTIARIGGDEFVVMLEDLSKNSQDAAIQTETIAHKIIATLNQPYRLPSHNYISTASIGATLFSGHQKSIEQLIKEADIAMYESKSGGRNTVRFFDPQMQANISKRIELETGLRKALGKNQFVLFYQPHVFQGHKVIGAEALIRWQHPRNGLILPKHFISLAEESNLILAIGQWVLETACAQIKLWEKNPLTRHLKLSLNVSARQFRQTDFVKQVTQAVNFYSINPFKLNLELTESMLLGDINYTIQKMNLLREIGVHISIDDFGTGYSSLGYLTKLPLDQIKIDQSFVQYIGKKKSDEIIVQTIIGMANNLGIDVIAEGVETEAQRQFLEHHHCQICQGYLFSEPLLINEFESLELLY